MRGLKAPNVKKLVLVTQWTMMGLEFQPEQSNSEGCLVLSMKLCCLLELILFGYDRLFFSCNA